MTTTLNGWDVEAMTQAITMVKEQPEAGLLTWRGRSIWDGGFGLDVRTREIEQLGEVMDRHFTLRSDHPPELLGHNTGHNGRRDGAGGPRCMHDRAVRSRGHPPRRANRQPDGPP